MAILTCSICLLFTMIAWFLEKKVYSPFILFNLWWGVTIFISSFGFFGILIPNDITYSTMLLAVLFFNFPMIFYFRKKHTENKGVESQKLHLIENDIGFRRLLLLIHIIVLSILITRSIKALQLMFSGVSYNVIRYNYFRQETIMSGYDHIINNLFVVPILTFSIIFISIQIFHRKINITLTISTLLCISLYVFSSGGRSIILLLVIATVSSYMLNKRNSMHINIGKKILLQLLLCVATFSLIYVSLERLDTGGDLSDVFNTVVRYFTAPYIYFENMLGYAKNDNVSLFGGAFFGGIIDVLIFMFRFLGFEIYPMSSYISEHNQTYIVISGDGAIYNAFPTMLYTFYYDGGYLGIIIGSFLFGLLSFITFQKFNKSHSLATMGIYITVILMIYESPMRWMGSFSSPWIVILLFIIYNLTTKKVKRY